MKAHKFFSASLAGFEPLEATNCLNEGSPELNVWSRLEADTAES